MKELTNAIAGDIDWKDEVEISTVLKKGYQANEINIVGNDAIISEDSAFDVNGVIYKVNTDEIVLTNIPDNDHSVIDAYYRMTYANDTWIIAAGSNHIYVSTDGDIWTQYTVGAGTTTNWYQVCWVEADSRWILVGSGGRIFTSTNATSWTERTSNNSNHFYGVAYSDTDDVAIAVTTSGNGSRSTDGGLTWSLVSSFTGQTNIKSIYWQGGIWVMAGVGGAISTSYGVGTVWTSRTTTGTDILLDVTSGPNNDVFLAVGFFGIVHRSIDAGANWTRIEMDTVETRNLYSAHYGDRFVIGGQEGGLWTSIDGETWTEKSTNLPFDNADEIIYGITYDGTTYRWCTTRGSICKADGFIDTSILITFDGRSFKSYRSSLIFIIFYTRWYGLRKGYYINNSNERIIAYYQDDPDNPINLIDQKAGKES